MIAADTLAQAEAELNRAEKSRSTGFEGRARVSARRAAGLVTRAFFGNMGITVGSASAYELLQMLRDRPELPQEYQQMIDHLLMRVNEEFQIPAQVDLIADARGLIQYLTKE